MDRRRFMLTALAGALAVPLAAAAQQAGGNRAWKVGWLALVPLPGLRAEFKEGMQELSQVEGSTYVLH
jgi:ABC-type sugar transport system substrate-binding protein